jgi:hypothetical protein
MSLLRFSITATTKGRTDVTETLGDRSFSRAQTQGRPVGLLGFGERATELFGRVLILSVRNVFFVHDFRMSRARAHVSRRGRQRSQDNPPNNQCLIPLWPLCRSSVASVSKKDRCLDHLWFRRSRAWSRVCVLCDERASLLTCDAS